MHTVLCTSFHGQTEFLKGKSLAIKNIKQNRIDDLEELGWE